MRFLQDLAGRVEEAAVAGGRFADALVRTAGTTVSGALVFLDREVAHATHALKRQPPTPPEGRKKVTHK